MAGASTAGFLTYCANVWARNEPCSWRELFPCTWPGRMARVSLAAYVSDWKLEARNTTAASTAEMITIRSQL